MIELILELQTTIFIVIVLMSWLFCLKGFCICIWIWRPHMTLNLNLNVEVLYHYFHWSFLMFVTNSIIQSGAVIIWSKYNIILQGALQSLRQNIKQSLSSQKTRHSSPSRVSYGVSFVEIWRKMTALKQHHTVVRWDISNLPNALKRKLVSFKLNTNSLLPQVTQWGRFRGNTCNTMRHI